MDSASKREQKKACFHFAEHEQIIQYSFAQKEDCSQDTTCSMTAPR